MKYDVIIAGAGNAGLSCARTAAAGGLNVLLIDKRRHDRLAHDWCDVIEQDVFQSIGLDLPPPAIWRPVTLPVFTTPDMKNSLCPDAGENQLCPNLYIDRKKMSEWLFGLIEPCRNIDVQTGTIVAGPEMEEGRVVGVRTAGRGPGASDVIKGDFVVDASGLRSVIGSRIPYSRPFRPDPVISRDIYIGIKEILPVDDADTIRRIGNKIIMGYGGGMAWTMVYWENMIDVGVAIPQAQRPRRIKRLLHELKHKLGLSSFTPARRGGGLLPARRCRTRLAGKGFLVAGDAACQINPSNGGGISPALLAGHIAGESIIQACRAGRNDIASLWNYPKRYIACRGAAYAGLDMMRLCFQSFPEKDIALLFRRGVIRINDLAVPFIKGQRPLFNAIDGLKRAVGCKSRPDLLAKLSRAILKAQTIEKAYRSIPAEYDEQLVSRWEDAIHQKVVK